jgi:hypothetical protein
MTFLNILVGDLMRDISLHILDIVMNSINASSDVIEINIDEQVDYIKFMIKDNGIGMSNETLSKVMDPFYTSRNTRKVGLGLSLLNENVNKTLGHLNIFSKLGGGTIVEATFNKNHIDCIPIGDIDETILLLIIMEPNINYIYKHTCLKKEFILNTLEIKAVLQDVPINEKSVINWLKENLSHKFA